MEKKKKAVQTTLRIRGNGDGNSLRDAAALLEALRAASGHVALTGQHLSDARAAGASRPFDVCIWPAALPPLDTGSWMLAGGVKIEATGVVRRVRTRAKLRRAVLDKAAGSEEPLGSAPSVEPAIVDPEPLWPPPPPSPGFKDGSPSGILGRLSVGVVAGGPAQLQFSRRSGPLTAVARAISTGLIANVATSETGRLTLELPPNTTDTVDAKGRLRLTWNNVYDVIVLDGAFVAERNTVQMFRVSP